MNDNDLLAAVREDFAGVRMSTEAEAILADGGSLRRRRRRRGAYGVAAMALCAVAAMSVASLTPGSSGTSGTSDAQLTAWTVQKQPDGTVGVTIRDMLDLAGLQRELNADGVPALVYSDETNPPGCVNAKASADMGAVVAPGSSTDSDLFVIHPSGIPAGSELLLDVFRGNVPEGPEYRIAAFGVRAAKDATAAKDAKDAKAAKARTAGAATQGSLALSTRMDIVYSSGHCQ